MLGETRAMFNAGLASEYDVLRFEVEKSNLEPSRRRAQNAAAAARRTLAIELGLEGDPSLQLEGPLTGVDIDLLADDQRAAGVVQVAHTSALPSSHADLVQQALSERSDLRQIGLTRELRRTELRAEQAEYLPKVNLFGTYLINAQGNGAPHFFGDSPNQRAYCRQVGVQVTMPLFAGFKRPARVSQTRAELNRVETQESLTRAQAEHEIETLAAQYAEALERARAQKAAVRQAQRGFNIASAQYREGMSGRLEVTDAELALRQSEFNYAQAVYDYLVSQAQLDRATGAVPFVDSGARTPLTTVGVR
jgi:outer membrane protein TolC